MQTSISRIHLKMQRMARMGCAAKIREIRRLFTTICRITYCAW